MRNKVNYRFMSWWVGGYRNLQNESEPQRKREVRIRNRKIKGSFASRRKVSSTKVVTPISPREDAS